jgi:ribosomal protein S20
MYSLIRQINNKGIDYMPIIKSAKKRVKVANKAAVRNSKTKRGLKDALKAFHRAVTGGKKEAKEAQSKAQSALDKAAKKNVMHKNKVARKQAQVAKAAKVAAGVTKAAKPATKKAAAPKKEATPKKAAVKKTVAKKPVVKKAPAKKPAAKK